MEIQQTYQAPGRRDSGDLPSGVSQLLFATITTASNNTVNRTALNLQNCADPVALPTGIIYMRGVPKGASAPVITTTDFDLMVFPGSNIIIPWGVGWDIYVYQESGTTIKRAAMELI